MNTLLITGTIMVTIALVCYTLAIFFEQRKRMLTGIFVMFLFLGFVFDLVSTILMMSGSNNGPFTIHGLIGFTSLFGMLLLFLHTVGNIKVKGLRKSISRPVHLFANITYAWWVISYITGAVIGMMHKF